MEARSIKETKMIDVDSLQVGQKLRIPCTFAPGPLDEFLICVQSIGGVLLGFIKTRHAIPGKDGRFCMVECEVKDFVGECVIVRIPAEFFHVAAGRVRIHKKWLESKAEYV